MKRTTIWVIFPLGLMLACGGHEQVGELHTADFNESSVEAEVDTNEIVEVSFTPMEMDFKEVKTVPGDLHFKGDLVDAWHWNDLNGMNYFVRSVEEPVASNLDGVEDRTYDFPANDQYLHAYHYVLVDESTEMELKRELLDFVKMCDFDLKVAHQDEVRFNDANQNNYGEITFGYMLACRSDVSPADFKVFTFEDGEKYGLRGTSVAMGYGGDYQMDDAMSAQSDSLQQIAIAYWEAHRVEFE